MLNQAVIDPAFPRGAHGAVPASDAGGAAGAKTPADVRMRRGQSLVVAGFVVTVIGIVAYCAACFTGGMSRDFSEILMDNAVPFAGTSLAVVGVGTLLWLVGSFMHLSGAMDLDVPDGACDGEPPPSS